MEAQIKLPPKLIPVFQDGDGETVRYRGAYGGRGSAKTRSFAKMAAVFGYMAGRAGREGIILCGREFMNSLEDSSLEELKGAIAEEEYLADYYEVGEKYIKSRDGRIRFVFAGLRENINSIKSKAKILLCWVDEAEHVREISWKKLIPTVREDGSEIWVTWNPESDKSATHLRFRVNPPKFSKIIEMNFRDNPWFPDVLEMERLADKEFRPDDYDHIWEGAFDLITEGAYYAKLLKKLEQSERFGSFPYRRHLPVHTSWDIGVDDYTAIWFWQEDGVTATVLDYYETSGDGAEQIVAAALPEHLDDVTEAARALVEMGRAQPFRYGRHYFPHDVKVREWGAGARTRVETLMGLGVKGIQKGAQLGPEERIAASRQLIPLTRFNDTPRVRTGLARLRRYSRKRNEALGVWQGPLHDENSHGADAFGEFAVNCPIIAPKPEPEKKPFNPVPGVRLGPPEKAKDRSLP